MVLELNYWTTSLKRYAQAQKQITRNSNELLMKKL